jgi:DNA-binding response OmpR family regulator
MIFPTRELAAMSHQTTSQQPNRRLVPVPDSATERPSEPMPVPPSVPAEGLYVDRALRIAGLDGTMLEMTYLQLELLAHLMDHPYRVHTRSGLMAAIWGYDHIGDGRTVDVHIARLRAILGPGHRDRIQTVRRVGYRFQPRPHDHPVMG